MVDAQPVDIGLNPEQLAQNVTSIKSSLEAAFISLKDRLPYTNGGSSIMFKGEGESFVACVGLGTDKLIATTVLPLNGGYEREQVTVEEGRKPVIKYHSWDWKDAERGNHVVLHEEVAENDVPAVDAANGLVRKVLGFGDKQASI